MLQILLRSGRGRARYDAAKHDAEIAPFEVACPMVRISRILKDYREAGTVNSLIALWGFVDDHAFLTKAGALGVVYRLRGVDYECLDHPQRQAIAHRFEQALRQLDESFRVYQYLHQAAGAGRAAAPHSASRRGRGAQAPRRPTSRQSATPCSSSSCTSWCSTRAGPIDATPLVASARPARARPRAPRSAKWLSARDRDRRSWRDQLARAVAHLHQKAEAFAIQLADDRPALAARQRPTRFACCAGS